MAKKIVLSIVATATLLLLICGCSPAAKKARFSERAEGYFKAGEYDKAKIEYGNVIKIDQGDANAYARIGAMWVDEGAPLRAGAFLIKALELAPDDTGSRLNLTRVYLSVGRTADARKEAMTVLEKVPGNGDALLALVDTSHTPREISATEEQLEKFPQKNSALYHLAVGGIAAK